MTRRFGTTYMEPVLIGLTVIDAEPDARSIPGFCSAMSWIVDVTVQPCCQP